jgi:Protein of unknown function (DUF2510)
VDDSNFGVPAGWYPDPLGLPQLRWWDAQAWTEHTSEARAPIIVQPATRVGYADDDFPTRYTDEGLPSRREQRERERERQETTTPIPTMFPEYADFETEVDPVREELSAQPLLAMTLKELEPPLTDTLDDGQPGPRRATGHTNAVPSASTLSALAEEMEAPVRVNKQLRAYTGAAWAIALMPAIQLTIAVLMITVFDLGANFPLMMLVLFAPYLIVLFFAAFDGLILHVWGHKHPASTWWALLAEPGYLIVRAFRTYRETGKGFATLGVLASGYVSIVAGILVLPGLLIAVLPGVFASEVESSVEADALALGATIEVSCPAPPLLIGDIFTCIRTTADGETDSIAVSLERQNGWISWRVIDWGTSVMIG